MLMKGVCVLLSQVPAMTWGMVSGSTLQQSETAQLCHNAW